MATTLDAKINELKTKVVESNTMIIELKELVTEQSSQIITLMARIEQLNMAKAKPKKVVAAKPELPETPTPNVTRARTNINQLFKDACVNEQSTTQMVRDYITKHSGFGSVLDALKIEKKDTYESTEWSKIATRFWASFLTEKEIKINPDAAAFRQTFMVASTQGNPNQLS